MGEPLDHRPPGWIRQSRECCIQFIHNRMVVDFIAKSIVNFAIPDYCSLISLNLTLALTVATASSGKSLVPYRTVLRVRDVAVVDAGGAKHCRYGDLR